MIYNNFTKQCLKALYMKLEDGNIELKNLRLNLRILIIYFMHLR